MTFWFSEDLTILSFPVGCLYLVPDQEIAFAFVFQMGKPIVISEQQNRCVCTHYGIGTIVFLRIFSSSAVMKGPYYVVLKHLCTQLLLCVVHSCVFGCFVVPHPCVMRPWPQCCGASQWWCVCGLSAVAHHCYMQALCSSL